VPFLLPHVGAGGVFIVSVLLAVAAATVVVYDQYGRAALAVAASSSWSESPSFRAR